MNQASFKKSTPVIVALLYTSIVVTSILTHSDSYQWDLKTYYYAAQAHAAGIDPYDIKALSQIAQTTIDLDFVYPPITLLFFRPFSILEFKTSYYLFLSLKFLLLIGLVYLWKKEFLKGEIDPLFYLYCSLAFNSTILADIAVGNISILEQFLLWLAFYFYLERRMQLFCLFILIAAVFKITPIMFLILLWFSEEEKKQVYLVGYSILFLAALLILYIAYPLLFMSFVRNAGELDERGIVNPSTLALVKDAFELVKSGIAVPQTVQLGLFLFIVVAIVVSSWRAYITLKPVEMKPRDKERIMVFSACLVYALVLPRFKNYSYILLLVPTYLIIKRATLRYLFLLTIMPTNMILPLILPMLNSVVLRLLGEYYPLLVAYIVWILYLLLMRNPIKALDLVPGQGKIDTSKENLIEKR